MMFEMCVVVVVTVKHLFCQQTDMEATLCRRRGPW